MGFEFYINVFGLDLCFEIPNKQKEKPRFEYFGQHNIHSDQTNFCEIHRRLIQAKTRSGLRFVLELVLIPYQT